MQPPQSVEEVKATLETTEKGGVRQSIRNCLTVFQRDPVLAGAIAYNILTDRKDIIWLQSLLIHVTMWAINIVIFVIVYGRMIEIYLLTSLAPIPVATLSNRELGNTGQNYLKSLFAVGFQGLLILVCVAIYAVLIQGIATSGDPIGAIWGCMGYSVLLCFCLFKTGSIARSVFSAH